MPAKSISGRTGVLEKEGPGTVWESGAGGAGIQVVWGRVQTPYSHPPVAQSFGTNCGSTIARADRRSRLHAERCNPPVDEPPAQRSIDDRSASRFTDGASERLIAKHDDDLAHAVHEFRELRK